MPPVRKVTVIHNSASYKLLVVNIRFPVERLCLSPVALHEVNPAKIYLQPCFDLLTHARCREGLLKQRLRFVILVLLCVFDGRG